MMRLIFLLMVVLVGTNFGYAQKQTSRERKEQKAAEIKELIDSGNFVFVALTANPLSGPKIDLTSRYDVIFKGDSVEAWLPYYGRAYQAPYNDREGGIKFQEEVKSIQTEFNERKKSYNIHFNVKSLGDSYAMHLYVSLSGYGTLNVNSNHRQSISFYGVVEAISENGVE